MKRKKMMLVVVGLFWLSLLAGNVLVYAETNTDGKKGAIVIKELTEKEKSAKDEKEKEKIRQNIRNIVPKNKEEIDTLFNFVEKEEGELQKAFLYSLDKVKDPNLGNVFRQRLKNGDKRVRAMAIKKAGEFKDKEAVPDLIDIVKGYREKKLLKRLGIQGDYYEQMMVISAGNALAEIGDERGIPVLLSKLGKMDNYEQKILSKFGKKAFPQLLEIYKNSKNEDEAKWAASGAIGLMTDKSIIPDLWNMVKNNDIQFLRTLLELTDDKTNPTRVEVELYIHQNADKNKGLKSLEMEVAFKNSDLEYLIRIAKDKNEEKINRENAIIYLGDLKTQAAVPALLEILNENKRGVSSRAATALEKITGKKYEWRKLK